MWDGKSFHTVAIVVGALLSLFQKKGFIFFAGRVIFSLLPILNAEGGGGGGDGIPGKPMRGGGGEGPVGGERGIL